MMEKNVFKALKRSLTCGDVFPTRRGAKHKMLLRI